MEEFIQMPSWIIDKSCIEYSPNIYEFLKTYDITDIEKIDLNYIRDYYRSDREKGINLIDELALRGFAFKSNIKSGLLPTEITCDEEAYIFVKNNGTSFKNISFKRLGIANLLERFNVTDDYFFQYIRLCDFMHLNRNILPITLKSEFMNNGFLVVDDLKFISCNLETKNDIRINIAYSEPGFILFRDFCESKGLIYMSELERFDFENLSYIKGFGRVKINKIMDRYKEYKKSKKKFSQDDGTDQSIDRLGEFYAKLPLRTFEDNIKIDNVFSENGFNKFREYCMENNLTIMGQLEDFPFEELINIKGFGGSKVSKIEKRYAEYKEESSGTNSALWVPLIVDEYYKEQKIESIKALDIDEGIIEFLKEQGVNNIDGIKDIDIPKIPVGKKKLDRFKENIRLLEIPPQDLLRRVLDEIKEDPCFEIYRYRSAGKLTLQEIGEKKNLTRERIRQLEKKIKAYLEGYFLMFGDYIINSSQNKSLIDNDFLSELYDEEMIYIKYALKNECSKRIVYLEEIDKFLVDKDVEAVKETLDTIVDELPEMFNYYDSIVDMDELLGRYDLEFLDFEDLKEYALKRGYKSVNKYMIKGIVSLRRMYSFIIKEYFKEGIRLSDDESIERVRNIVFEKFGIEDLSENNRAIQGAIGDENVLCDRGTYIHPDFVDIPDDLLEKIKAYIDENLKDTMVIGDIFCVFESELLERSNITNKYFLHGVLRYYYNDEYLFSRDNLSKISGEVLSTHMLLEKLLREKGEPMSKDEIKTYYPGWTDIMFNNAVRLNKNIIYWDNNCFLDAKLLEITEDDINRIQTVIEKYLDEGEGYTNANTIFKRIRLSMNDFFKRNYIKNYFNLFSLMEKLFGEKYYFRRPHILRNKTEKQFTSIDVFYKLIHERQRITYEEFRDYFNKFKFNESTIYDAFKRVSDDLMQISKTEYILKENFDIDDEKIKRIEECIYSKLNDNEYIPMLSIMDFSGYPDVGYEWNPYLLEGIIKRYIKDLRLIEKDFKDRRYRCSTVVRKDSSIKNMTDLIIYVIQNEYMDKENMTLYRIQDFLITKYIILKTIPVEVWECERISIDEYNRIEIKGE